MRHRGRAANVRIFGFDAMTLKQQRIVCDGRGLAAPPPRLPFIHVICGTAENCISRRPPAAARKIDSVNAAQHGASSSRVGGLRFPNLPFLHQLIGSWLSPKDKKVTKVLTGRRMGKENEDRLIKRVKTHPRNLEK